MNWIENISLLDPPLDIPEDICWSQAEVVKGRPSKYVTLQCICIYRGLVNFLNNPNPQVLLTVAIVKERYANREPAGLLNPVSPGKDVSAHIYVQLSEV